MVPGLHQGNIYIERKVQVRYGESRNVLPLSVHKPLLLVLVVKLLRVKGVGIGPITESCVNWRGPIAMVPCLYRGNIYIKNPFYLCRSQTIPSEERRYRVEIGNFG